MSALNARRISSILIGLCLLTTMGCGDYQDRYISVEAKEIVGTWRFTPEAVPLLMKWGATARISRIRFSADMTAHLENFPLSSLLNDGGVVWITTEGTWRLNPPCNGVVYLSVTISGNAGAGEHGGFLCVRDRGVLQIEIAPDHKMSIEAGTVVLEKEDTLPTLAP